jgi:hypothetical protein
MNHKLILVTLALLLHATTGHAALFGNEDRLNKVEQELYQSRQDTGGWMFIAGILGIGSTILFGIGAAIGARVGRRWAGSVCESQRCQTVEPHLLERARNDAAGGRDGWNCAVWRSNPG